MTVADPNWSSVTLLMHCDDFVNTKTSVAATQVGSPTIDTSTFLFGSGSLYCTSGNYLTFPDSTSWDFGTGDFTIEFCVRFAGSTSSRVLMGQGSSGVGWRITTDAYGAVAFTYNDGVYARTGATTTTLLMVDTWYRICIMRTGTYIVTMIDGERAGYSFSYGHNITGSTNDLAIGLSADVYFDEVRITKDVARYDTFSYTLPTEEYPNADHPQYALVLTDSALANDSPYAGPGVQYIERLSEALVPTDIFATLEYQGVTDTIYALDAPVWVAGLSVSETIQVIDSTATVAGAALSELLRASESVAFTGSFNAALADAARVLETARLGIPVELSDPVTVSWVLNVAQGFQIVEALKINEVLSGPATLAVSVSDAFRVRDALANFFHFDLAEALTVQETMTGLARHIASVNEPITVSESLARYFVLSAEAFDEAVLDDAFTLKMLFQPQVQEQIRVSALLVEPNGGVTTWAVNTRTGAVTEYTDYAFNSFAQSNRHYLGASSTGLYQLDGDDDAGQPTIAHIRSGYAQFGGSRYTGFKAAYLGLRGDGSVFLKLDTGDGKSYTYKSVVQDQQSTKVRFGKGLRARYFAFELISEGQDFDLDTIEFLPVVAQRRV